MRCTFRTGGTEALGEVVLRKPARQTNLGDSARDAPYVVLWREPLGHASRWLDSHVIATITYDRPCAHDPI